MTLLTFLGTGNYQETTYSPCDFSRLNITAARENFESKFFAAALAHWTQPTHILIVSTPEASATHKADIREQLSAYEVEFLELPFNAGTEADVWKYFEKLTNRLSKDQEIIADITHGYRSVPVVTLLALTYLRVTKGIQVKGLYYGAFDAVPRESSPKPTFDLSPFLDLLAWTSAADSFLATGDAKRISHLMENQHNSLRKDHEVMHDQQPKTLKTLANSIKIASADLRLLRLQNLENSLSSVENLYQAAKAEVDQYLKPFAELIKLVKDELIQHRPAAIIAGSKGEVNSGEPPTQGDQTDLDAQLKLIEWLAERGHTAAALTLAREWIVTCLAANLEGQNSLPLVSSNRCRFEYILNRQISKKEKKQFIIDEELSSKYHDLSPELTKLFESLWSKTTAPRNDLNHANHSNKSHKSKNLADTVGDIIKEFPKLLPKT